jgi:hypothetical protein
MMNYPQFLDSMPNIPQLRCTIGFPAIGINGLGMVNVCGRRRDPRPAIGTIIFMFLFFFKSSFRI